MTASRQLKSAIDGQPARPGNTEQSNTSMIFGDQIIVKMMRRVDPGPNPELEVGRFLTERAGFEHSAPLLGALEVSMNGKAAVFAVVHRYVPNLGDAFSHTVTSLSLVYEQVAAHRVELGRPPSPQPPHGHRRRGARRGTWAGRGAPSRGHAARSAHRRDASRPHIDAGRPRVRPAAPLHALPALLVPVDPVVDKDQLQPAAPAPFVLDPSPGRAGRHGPRARARLARGLEDRHHRQDRCRASSDPWRLSPGPGPLHRERLRGHRLRRRAAAPAVRAKDQTSRVA